MHCSLCEDKSVPESEMHLLKCPIIVADIGNEIDLKNANYKDIFSNDIQKQVKITKIFDKVFKSRKILLAKQTWKKMKNISQILRWTQQHNY